MDGTDVGVKEIPYEAIIGGRAKNKVLEKNKLPPLDIIDVENSELCLSPGAGHPWIKPRRRGSFHCYQVSTGNLTRQKCEAFRCNPPKIDHEGRILISKPYMALHKMMVRL